MSGEEDAFLRALKDDPSESDSREVYADWLEENGRGERAEYLRLEAEVRGFDFITGNPERAAKKARRDELEDALARNDATWLAEVSRVARVRVALPRPSGLGRAEPIPSRPSPKAPPDVPFTDGFPSPLPLDARPMPALPRPGWSKKLALEILIAVVVVFLVEDITTKGFLERLMKDFMEHYYPGRQF